MKKHLLLIIIAATVVLVSATNGFAYRVSLSTFFATSNSATFLNTWSNVAARAEVLDPAHGGVYNFAEDPETNGIPPTFSQWQAIFRAIQCATNGADGYARSTVSRDPTITNALAYSSITNLLAGSFSDAAKYGYGITHIMFYDNALTINGTNINYNWTTTEVQYMRSWLDANGYPDVLLSYDARNNGVAVRNMCASPLVGSILLEAGPHLWFSNAGSRWALLQWLWTNSATAGKDLVFQVVEDGIPDPYGLAPDGTYPANGFTNNFMYARQLVVWLGNTLMGYDFLRSPRVVFKPITYNSPMVQWSPETIPDGGLYTNTMAGVTLSLIEQRAFFEGRMGTLPTDVDAFNFMRTAYPAMSALANQTVNMNTSTAALPFSLSSQGMAPAALAVSAYSSNPFLVPDANIVIRTWSSTDLGSVGAVGSNTLGDVITMTASGADISGTADVGRFIYQPLAVDGAMVVRVTDLQPVNAWSKAGVMMRASTNAGSANCFMHVTASNGVEFTWRAISNGTTASNKVAGVTAPCWVKLVKTGTNFAGYYAADNAGSPGSWVQLGSSVGLSVMSSNLLSGVAGTSHNNAGLGTAIFDNVSGNTNRAVTVTPAPNQGGAATINLVVSDGWLVTTNAFTLTVPASGGNTPPTISLPTNSVRMYVNSADTIAFTVGDGQTPAGSLLVAGSSANTSLVPNANLVFGGSGSNRTLTITPAPDQTGSGVINLGVSDGTNSAGYTLFLTVLPPRDIFPAITSGAINDTNTWGAPLPLPGDTNTWLTGNFSLRMTTGVETFNGGTFVVQAGGQFAPQVPTVTLTLNNLVLDGGLIYMGNNIGLTISLSGKTFTLNSGTIQAGTASGGRSVKFQNGSLVGSGTIDITAVPSGSYVQFQSTINTTNFSGTFSVHDNGILYLPAITSANASFGLNLSGNGVYYNNTAVAVTSLIINGTNIPPGTYTYTTLSNFSAFIGNNGGTITIVNSAPTLGPVFDRTLIAGQTLTLTNVATDPNVPPQTLTFSLLSPPAGATINATNGVFSWRPTIAQAPATYPISVKVADNGSPSLSATNTFFVNVNQPVQPALSNPGLTNGQFHFTISGDTGPDYVLQTSSNLAAWISLQTNYAPVMPSSVAVAQSAAQAGGFFRVKLLP